MRQDNLSRLPILRYPVLALAVACCLALLAVACGLNDETDLTLPNGKYPLTLTATVEVPGATRATTDNSWSGNEEVAIRVNSEVIKYMAATNGTLSTSAETPLAYWQTSAERKTVEAWYSSTYSATIPTSFTVRDDQTSDGYQQSDFLYAPAKEISFNDRNQTNLPFYHQTARVVLNIKNAEAATNAADIQRVVIGDAANLVLSGAYAPPAGAGNTVGTWDTSKGSLGTIIPKDITSTGSGYLKTYAALVIPQQMQGEKFIAITLNDGYTYYYIPAGDEANLQAGKVHTYDITVMNTYLKVEARKSGEWSDDGQEPVKSLVKTFTSEELKVGDFYYSDGEWSDGGLRALYGDTMHFIDESIKPVLTYPSGGTRQCIGIVMKVGRDNEPGDEWKDDCMYQNRSNMDLPIIYGYVLALYDANSGERCSWGPDTIVDYVDSNKKIEMDRSDRNGFYGYKNTEAIDKFCDKTIWDLGSFPAAYRAKNYSSIIAANSYSSNWFLPSIGQCRYWYKYRYVILSSVGRATGDDKYKWQKSYWSSTESKDNAKDLAMSLDFDFGSETHGRKSVERSVRACLAFGQN